MNYPSTLPDTHQRVLERIIQQFQRDPRIVGMAASGSYATNTMDKYSDLDLVIAISPEHYSDVFEQRFTMINQLDGMTAAFTGEHVGEPRLVIAIFAPDAIHVDFKFVVLNDAAKRVDHNAVLWERDGQLTQALGCAQPSYPQPDPQWIEDRFWIWTHYAATKIARGEYFEALEFISFLRQNVLSPLALKQQGLTPSGVRTIETRLPEFARQLQATVAIPNESSLTKAMEHCITLYLQLRRSEQVEPNTAAQTLCCDYFKRELQP
ncbi:nucleotidyltransferase domain-containing protein [Aliagarivorans marinus]|uniref:nucleotidyltransferase domain-containing protein n=1 Tax=Aliagarivorans marinus TaxID=561965 RepID=UPI0004124079|nr:nucleotidyltransferase domain-containing protein [Aliagarivorans marinus]